MLDPKKIDTSKTNQIEINGTLSEFSVEEKKTSDGREYVTAKATVRVDQEINGEVIQNDIPVRMFSMRKKSSDGTLNPNYDRILGYRTELVPMSIVEDPNDASRVYIGGNSASIEENLYVNKSGNITSIFQINTSFINKAKKAEEDKATFELVGVVGKMKEEVDREGEETGRLIVSFIVFGYNGKANVIDLIAEDVPGSNSKTFIENHWEEGDTVNVAGLIKMSYKTIEWEEEQGFGAPIKRHKTVGSRELLIKAGAGEGFEESLSYDPDLVNLALEEREKTKQGLMDKKPTTSTTSSANKKKPNFGF